MNRFVLGTCLLVVSPFVAGCSNFYVLNPPEPLPMPTPVPPPPAYPIDPTEGTNTTLAAPTQGIALNTAPTKFRAVDVRYVPRVANDPANAMALLVLQTASPGPSPATPGTTTAGAATAGTATTAQSTATLGPADVNNPVRLAGIIVPGEQGQAAAGLQDPDLLALQNLAFNKSREALRSWSQGPLLSAPVPSTTPTTTPTATARARGSVRPTATSLPRAITRDLDVYQDPRYPVDSESRRVVQVFFTSVDGIKGRSAGASTQPAQVLVQPGASLSINRMMIRAGWAVVDLYSSTAFDQQTWLLDEAYARNRRLGMWGLQLNGKRLSLQQRAPVPSTGTGARSKISVTTNLPRIIKSSGTNVQRGPSGSTVLPPASESSASAPAAPSTGPGGPGSLSSSAPGTG